MTEDLWSERAEAFRESAVHRSGKDLDLLVEWCEPRPGVTALDVATGGGHVARRLREAGCSVVTVDPAPGMRPDVLARAEDMPFADGSFDVVACRIAAHHFEDVPASSREMARIAGDRVVIEDLLYEDEEFEEAHRIRDPSHVRSLSEQEWRSLLGDAGLRVDAVEVFDDRRLELEPWLERVGCRGEEAERVRELLSDRTDAEGRVPMRTIVIRGRTQ
ncbi:MAG: methyltransferase domain-containing protein [Actinobacteria bacterium]|nr:MAG: methyltransferase domain-containing protein [Actinomycetota bacterium]